MKKHVLGLTIFGFIFASFAFAFAFFYAPPIPEVEEVRLPVYKSEPTASCRKSAKKLSYEIISSQLDLEKNKLYTRVSLKWNGREPAPKSLFVNFAVSKPSENMVIYESTNVVSAFAINNRAEVLIETDVDRNSLNGKLENIYTKLSISEQFVNAKLDESYSESFPVVVSHGHDSATVKKGQLVVR